jgi:peptide/nickel transport system permease protein
MSTNIMNPRQSATNSLSRHPIVGFFFRLVKEKPLGTIGGLIVLILLLVAIMADIIAPFGYSEIHIHDKLIPSSAEYILGTDNLGRDVFSRVIYGARISVVVGLLGTLLSTFVSVSIGMTCGFLGGKFDFIVQRLVDAWMCFPALIILLTVMSILGPGLFQIIIVVGISLGIGGSRIIRGAVISIKENMYMSAAQVIGCSTWRILTRHIFRNITASIIILFSTNIGVVILSEASLSFLGFGIPPPTPSWGGMISGPGRTFMLIAPWMGLWPGVALGLVIWGTNMFGDAIRDLLDPRLKGGIGRYGKVKIKQTLVNKT